MGSPAVQVEPVIVVERASAWGLGMASKNKKPDSDESGSAGESAAVSRARCFSASPSSPGRPGPGCALTRRHGDGRGNDELDGENHGEIQKEQGRPADKRKFSLP